MQRELIMIVEDEEIVAHQTADLLVEWGYDAVTASSGEEAVELAATRMPVLALMDIKLAGAMDGIEAADILRERYHIAVIYLTAFSEISLIRRAKLTMPVSYLVKPVQEQELRASIETALYIRQVVLDRRVAEEKNRMLADIVESSDDAIIGKTLDGIITSWNRGAENMYGYLAEEAIGRHISMLLLSGHGAELQDIMDRIRKGERVDHFETVRVRKNGEMIAVSLSVSPIINSRGGITGASSIARDITRQKRAEEELRRAHAELERRVEERTAELRQAVAALKESEARYRTLFENAQVGIGVTECDGTINITNPAMREMLGMAEGDRRDFKTNDMYENRADRDRLMDELKNKGRVRDFQTRLNKKDGSSVDVSIRANIIEWNGHEAIISLIEDVTERKQALEALIQAHADLERRVLERTADLSRVNRELEESNRRLEFIQYAAGAGAWDWDIPGGVLAWSDTMFELFGLDRNTATATFETWRSVLHPADLQGADERINRALEERKDLANEYRVVLPDGTIRWIYAVGRGAYEEGAPVRMSGICLDITPRKRTEEMLRKSEEKFSRAFMMSPEAITIAAIDDGSYLDVNEAFSARTGYSREEAIGRTSADLNVWVDTNDRDRFIRELTGRGRLRGFDIRFRMRSGEIRDFMVSSEIIEIDERKCSLNFILDITERKRVEEVLRQEHDNFLKIFAAAPVGLLLLDEDTVVSQANAAVGSVVLREPAAIIGSRAGGGIGCIHSEEDPRGCGFSSSCPVCPLRRGIEAALATGVRISSEEISLTLRVNGMPVERWLSVSSERVVLSGRPYAIVAVEDITDFKIAQMQASAERELLALCNGAGTLRELMGSLMRYFAALTGCEAVGVRLRDGDDYPYYETRGLPEDFVLAERSLCARDAQGLAIRDGAGNPVLDCMCGNILQGRFDPSKPFFSPHGSFWSNCTTELLATTSEEDRQARTRNRCNGEGYESVALVPMRFKGEVFGLFQFNDRRRGMFSAEKIQWLERQSDYVAIAMSKLIADEDLRQQKEILETIMNNIPVMIAYMNDQGQSQWVNRQWTTTLGWTLDETRKMDVIAEMYPDAEYRRAVLEFIRNARGAWGEFLTRTRSGTVLHTAWANVALSDGTNIGIGQDISERKRTEEARLRLIRNLESLWGLSAIQDRDIRELTDYILGEMKKLSDSAYAFYGIISDDESEMTVYSWSKDVMDECAVDGRPMIYKIAESGIWAEAVRARRVVVVNDYASDFPGKHGLPSGHVSLTRLASVPVMRSGRVVAVGAVANKGSDYTDDEVRAVGEFLTNANIIMDRKRAESRLRLSEERYRTVADFTFDWEFWIDPAGHYVYVSPSCERMTGYTAAEFLADPGLMLSIVHPADREMVGLHLSDFTGSLLDDSGIDFRIIRKDGARRWIGHRCQGVYTDDGRYLGRRGSHRDITNRKEAENEIVKLTEHIIELQEDERQRVARDLHDGVSQMIMAAKLNLSGFRQDPEANSERFAAGMEFLDLASRELREVYSNLYPSVLADLGLASAVRLYVKNYLANRGIETEVDIRESLDIPEKFGINIYRIIQEGCSNIVKHANATQAGVSIATRDGSLHLVISDNGSGFSVAREDHTESGMGLVNMRQRTRYLGGELSLDTGPEGSVIRITIPLEGGGSERKDNIPGG